MNSSGTFGSMTAAGATWTSMRELTKKAILRLLQNLNSSGSLTYRVLILDQRATRVLGAALRMFDVTEHGVALVESLEKKRQPFPGLEAIYIVDPKTSVPAVCSDFGEEKCLYSRAHIFFLRHCEDEQFALIKQQKPLISRCATLTELNLNYLAIQDSVFTLDMDTALVELYNEPKMNFESCVSDLLDNLVTFCATLNEYPFIRFPAKSDLCAMLADEFQKKFNSFVNANNSFWWKGDGGDGHGELSSRATLIMLDRSEDPVVPMLHNFHYQALINDLFVTRDELVWYYKGDSMSNYAEQDQDPDLVLNPVPDEKSNVGVCILNEEDQLWTEFRYLHISEVCTRLGDYVKKYTDTAIGKMNRGTGASALSLEEMNKIIQELPEYKEVMAKNALHVRLSELIMLKIRKKRLLEIAAVEQAMATGVTNDGVEAKAVQLSTDLMKLLRDPEVSAETSARLIGIYIVSQRGIEEANRRHILEACNPPLPLPMHTCLLNLSYVGAQVQSSGGSTKKTAKEKQQIAEAIARAKTGEKVYGRYKPAVGKIVEDICTNRLPTEMFPYIIEPPPLSMPSPSRGPAQTDDVVLSVRRRPNNGSPVKQAEQQAGFKKQATRKRNPKGARLIVFIAGGASIAELSSIQTIMGESNRDVIIGTTHIVSPKSYLHDLKFMESTYVKGYYEERAQAAEAKQLAVQKRMQQEAQKAGISDQTEEEIAGGDARPEKPKKKGFFSCGCFDAPPAAATNENGQRPTEFQLP